MKSTELAYISETQLTANNKIISRIDTSITYFTPSEIIDQKQTNDDLDVLSIIIDLSEDKKQNKVIDAIDESHKSIPVCILSSPSKKLVCNSINKENFFHINTESDDEIIAKEIEKHINAFKIEREKGSICHNNIVSEIEVLREIHKVGVSKYISSESEIEIEYNVYNKKVKDRIKSYLTILSSAYEYAEYAISKNTHPKENKEEILLASEGVSNEVGDIITIPEEVKVKNDANISIDKIKNISNIEKKSNILITNAEYKTYITTPIVARNKRMGYLFLLREEKTDVIPKSEKNIINTCTHIIAQDIKVDNTQSKLKKKLEKLKKFKYMISHDIISPLTTAKGRIQIAKENTDSDHIEMGYKSIFRMELMIDRTERLLQAGESIDMEDKVSIRDIAEDSWNIINSKEATLSVRDDFELYADSNQLKTILENLFKNSIEHGGRDVNIEIFKKTPIRTSTRQNPNEKFKLIIQDDGEGINEEMQGEIFERGKTSKSKEDVSGFGLSIIQTIVDAHDWEINIDPHYNQGARFEISNVR